MKFTVNWLRQFVDTDLPAAAIADRLTMLGLEVDSVEEVCPHLASVVVARIVEVSRHPDADRLVVCRVDAGGEPLTVVCGASNPRVGLVSALALPGTIMPDGLEIRKSKIRGQVSEGMFCSARDLRLGDDHDGIIELAADLAPGNSLRKVLGLDDTVIEIDLTPNRPDCTSVIGVAREIAGVLGISPKIPDSVSLPVLDGVGQPFDVTVDSPADCPRYAARLLTGLAIAPSPDWLKNRLLAVGLRPINNVVDITNFVMLEYGQPLHAFDFDRIAGGRIVVRQPRQGETIVTLDGQERKIEHDMLMICDDEKPVAVAGVMGGENSEVSSGTTRVLLESAYFNPVSIRRASRRLGLSTDASYRFERGIDPHLAPLAMERAVSLMVEICGATVHSGGFDLCFDLPQAQPIRLRVRKVVDLLGVEFTAARIYELLASIQIPVQIIDELTLEVQPPSFRVDLEREVDLVEEIARLTGYNEIPATLPLVPLAAPCQDRQRVLRKMLVETMCSLGFYEAINYSFGAGEHCDRLCLPEDDKARKGVRLLNPIADNQAVMRTMLLPGLLENVSRNLNYHGNDLRLFEIGKVFFAADAPQPEEHLRLTAVLAGRRHPESSLLHYGADQVDLADAHGVVEQIASRLMLPEVSFAAADNPVTYVDPECVLAIQSGGVDIGICGCIDSRVLRSFGIKQDVYFIDCDLGKIASLPLTPKKFMSLPRFPAVRWDIAVVVPDSVGVGHMLDHVRNMGHALVEQIEIFDIYRGAPVAKGYKSVGLTVQYRSPERTLDDVTVNKVHQNIIESLLTRFKGRLREGNE